MQVIYLKNNNIRCDSCNCKNNAEFLIRTNDCFTKMELCHSCLIELETKIHNAIQSQPISENS